jgi:hypothetical protein
MATLSRKGFLVRAPRLGATASARWLPRWAGRDDRAHGATVDRMLPSSIMKGIVCAASATRSVKLAAPSSRRGRTQPARRGKHAGDGQTGLGKDQPRPGTLQVLESSCLLNISPPSFAVTARQRTTRVGGIVERSQHRSGWASDS